MALVCGKGVAGRRRLVVQPGGLTLGFALHLIITSALSVAGV